MSTQQEDKSQKEETTNKNIFEDVIEQYITQLNSLVDSVPIVLNVLSSNAIMQIGKLDKFFNEQGLKDLNEETTLQIPFELYANFDRLNTNTKKAIETMRLYPCNIVVSFVSLYDAFLGNIIKAIYKTCPEKLKESKKEFTINDIILFDSIEDAKEFVIEKESETVLRASHGEQLDWLKNKFGTTFKDFPNYNKFIEITERRNLFVHTNGVVSRQYISECNKVGVKDISKIKVGEKLIATPQYILECYNILFEVGVKLGIIVWRNILKKDKDADYYYNTVCYDLLKSGKYNLAKTMLDFATNGFKSFATEEIRRIYIINKALACYLAGDKKGCNLIIDKEDWSASAVMFQLAVAVLKEDYKLAASKMESAKSDVDNAAYCEWPLFKDFRNTDEFKVEYQRLFGQGFEYTEPPKENIKNVLSFAMDFQNMLKDYAKKNNIENELGFNLFDNELATD
ncbi:MAG: hypothetical protein E7092_09130 [Bacteroidales bacterium]|nr:hypothetical protein [Bacteroidales bacterium]